MAAPIATRDVIHLDSLLASAHPTCVGRKLTRGHLPDEIEYPPLPVARLDCAGEWVYMTSAAIWPDEARRGREHFTTRKDATDIEIRAGTWSASSGPERAYQVPVPTTETPRVSWLAIGDRRGVRLLLRRVRHVGIYRRQGYGIVQRWEVEVVDAAPERVLVSPDGLAARHLPAAWCEPGAAVSGGRWLPPYWHPDGGAMVRAGARADVRGEVLGRLERMR